MSPVSEAHREAAQRLFDNKTKPLGSLGVLESLAAQLCAIQQRVPPRAEQRHVLLFAGDHGIVAEGVSLYPQVVTTQMVANFAAGGAAINVLARQFGATLEIVDVGVAGSTLGLALDRKIRTGTRSFLQEAAMTPVEVQNALDVGRERVESAVRNGLDLLALGEMGIGNTASAAALLSLLIDVAAEETVGRGAGLDDAQLQHKRDVITRAVAFHAPRAKTPFEILCAVGGLEIAALVGAMLAAGSLGVPILVDGFICTVAALTAVAITPAVRDYMIFAHRSAEQGHAIALAALRAEPLLDLGMRLGEGSGAALAFPLVEASVRLLREMASFESAGVSTADTPTSPVP
ncbi:MAG: nicotinate-nucleotide-dimethylbenzimidazole phosphoribosyltransferase [Chthonomonadaceae bacterium]|nr:nicotinate-nucleotide-dimethylbenzimidazole phosphoribosyltransferase [Chthonomonadaceae bacterium]